MLRDEHFKKKQELEDTIKNAITKFIDETGLMIDYLQTSSSVRCGVSDSLSREDYDKLKIEALMYNLKIIVISL